MLAEGGFHRIIPPLDPAGDRSLRTHPAKQTVCDPALSISIASASRFQTQGIKQSKSHRNGLLLPDRFNASNRITNRVMLWKECRNIYVNNFVRNYSHYLLHIHTTFTTAFSQHPLLVNMFVTSRRHLSNIPQDFI